VKIITLLKRVPDTEAKIIINQEGTGIKDDGIKYVINTYDEYAVEEGLRLRDKAGAGSTVTVVCVGPEEATELIRTALAMGADDAVHICDTALEGSDPFVTAAVLAKAIKDRGFDIVFCGKQAIDDDMGQVHSILAEMLDIPQVNVATAFEMAADAKRATVRRRIEGGDEKVETGLPAIVSCEKGLNEPRYASLPGIMKAKKKEIRKRTMADLGFDHLPGEKRSSIVRWVPLPKSTGCTMVQAEDVRDAVKELVRLLREDAKVI
jgi:electron transfer flavoprotein beta subunit